MKRLFALLKIVFFPHSLKSG